MKSILIILVLFFSSSNCWSMNLTARLQVIRINYNEKKKNYDVTFSTRAGIYHTEKKHLKCLQESISKKVEMKVEFEAMGLKIIKCTNL